MVTLQISETDEYDRLVEMFIRHGLEFSFEEPLPTDLVKCWKAEDEQGTLVGGCVLAMRGGEYVIDGIATEPAYRKERVGSRLLRLALDEVKHRGADRIYLVAKAPDFFRKHDFQEISADEVPDLFDCPSCPQYLKTCFPEIMKLTLSHG